MRAPQFRVFATSLGLLLCLAPACGAKLDHIIAVAKCGGPTIKVVERYRRQGFSGWTGDTRYVLIVTTGRFWGRHREIDITPTDTVDLTALERHLPVEERWRALAPHQKASRRVFVPPAEFSVAEYDAIASCLAEHASEINRSFTTPRPPVEYFEGDGFRERWAGLRSIVYKQGDWVAGLCQASNTTGFRLPCAGLDGLVTVRGYGQVQICVASDPTMPCGRDVGKIQPDGAHALVRPPARSPRCAQGALETWLGQDPLRFTRDCRLPTGRSLADLFTLRESEDLKGTAD